MDTNELQTTVYSKPIKAGPGLVRFMKLLRQRKEEGLAELESQMDYYFGNFRK